jgi:class 3 adenylate cyclase
MALSHILALLDQQASAILAEGFQLRSFDTAYVPLINDPDITHAQLDEGRKYTKKLQTCVLQLTLHDVDALEEQLGPERYPQVHAAVMQVLTAGARQYGGHLRALSDDGLSVLFDRSGCFQKATDTAILLHSLCRYLLVRHLPGLPLLAGIGIDHGAVVASRCQPRPASGDEGLHSLIWLGSPVRRAARLAAAAQRSHSQSQPGVREGSHHVTTGTTQWKWRERSYEDFLDDLESTNSCYLKHRNSHFQRFERTLINTSTEESSPILLTQEVLDGLRDSAPDHPGLRDGWWKPQPESVRIEGYDGTILGGDMVYAAARQLPSLSPEAAAS